MAVASPVEFEVVTIVTDEVLLKSKTPKTLLK